MQGKKHYTEQLFKSFQLSQRVPEDNFYRRLKGLLDLQWLYKETKKYYGTDGQQSIDPAVFFKLMLIGYLENLGKQARTLAPTKKKIKGEEDLQLHLYKGFNLFKVMQAYYRVAVQAHNVQELPAVEELACRFSE